MAFEPKTWADGPEGETPITADELNRIEAGISDAHEALDGKADAGDVPDVSGLATKSELSAGLAGKADSSDIPDVSGFATTADLAELADRVAALEPDEG